MVFPRPSCLQGAVGRSTLGRASQQARTKSFRNIGRRTYASGHETKKSSDIPWIIGSVGVTVPAATWLLGQTPAKSDHGHHDEEPHVVTDEEGSQEEAPQEEESKDQGEEKPSEEPKEDSDEGKAESKEEEPKSDDSGSDDEGKDTPPTSDDEQEYDPPGPDAPGQINKNTRKGPGEQQKGGRKRTETKGERDAQSEHSGATNPRLQESGKSNKAEGVRETAKIHGTVDPKQRSSIDE